MCKLLSAATKFDKSARSHRGFEWQGERVLNVGFHALNSTYKIGDRSSSVLGAIAPQIFAVTKARSPVSQVGVSRQKAILIDVVTTNDDKTFS